MADSNRLTIIKFYQAKLQAMTVAGGYHWNVVAASVNIDPTVNPLTVNGIDVPYFSIEPTPTGRKDYYPANQLRELLRVNIIARMDADGVDPGSRLDTIEKLGQDMEKALTVDITCGGAAVDVRLGVMQPVVVVGSNIVLVIQPVEARLHRSYGAA